MVWSYDPRYTPRYNGFFRIFSETRYFVFFKSASCTTFNEVYFSFLSEHIWEEINTVDKILFLHNTLKNNTYWT